MTKVAMPTDASARTPTPAEGRAGRRGIVRAAAIRSDIRAMVRRKVRDDSEGDKSGIDTPWAPTLTSHVGFDGAGPERDSLPTWRGVLMTALIVVVVVALIFLAYSFALTETRAR